jgi:hypothetical protein
LAAEIPIRIVEAFRPPDATLTPSTVTRATMASVARERAVRFLILPPFAAARGAAIALRRTI